MGQCSGGSAEVVAADERISMPVPSSPDGIQAAAKSVAVGHVGGAVLRANLEPLTVGGRLVSVDPLGSKLAQLDLERLARMRVRLLEATSRTNATGEKRRLRETSGPALLAAARRGPPAPGGRRVSPRPVPYLGTCPT